MSVGLTWCALLEAGAAGRLLERDELMHAVALGSFKEVEQLLAQGTDLEARDGWDRTP